MLILLRNDLTCIFSLASSLPLLDFSGHSTRYNDRVSIRVLSTPFYCSDAISGKKQYAHKPIYTLDKPLDVAAALLLGTLKCEGEISSEQKSALTSIFENNFQLENSEAADLLLASSEMKSI